MCARKGSIGFVVFLVLVIALCWQMPARAAITPPTIDEILGTYLVTDKEVYYYFEDGIPRKDNYTGEYALTWRITKTSDSIVQVYIEDWDWPFTAYYKNGFLVQSSGDVSNPAASWAALGIALFSGKPGKVKFKGDFGWGQYGGGGENDYCEWDPYVGKMISSPTLKVGATLANQDDEQEVLEAGEEAVPLATTLPLSITDLPGTYLCTLTGTIYYPTAGGKGKEKDLDIVTITPTIDNQTLNISMSEGDIQAHCIAGILMLSDVDDPVQDTNARFGILLAKGKPGKISLKGKIYSVRGLEAPEGDEFEVTKVSCKQVSP